MVQTITSNTTARVLPLEGQPLPSYFSPTYNDSRWQPATDIGPSTIEGALRIAGPRGEFLFRQGFWLDNDNPEKVEVETEIGGTLVEARLNGFVLSLKAPDPDGITRWTVSPDILRPGRKNVLALHIKSN